MKKMTPIKVTPIKETLKDKMKFIIMSFVSMGLFILIYYLMTILIYQLIINFSKMPRTILYFGSISIIFVISVVSAVIINFFLSRRLKELIVEEEKIKKRKENKNGN